MPTQPVAPPARPANGGEHLGERRLTTIHAIGQSLAIGPIFSAGLLLGLVAGAAGFNTPLSVVLGSLGALALAYVVSLFARRYAGAGAIYEYLVRGANRDLGVFAAGAYSLGLLCLGGGGVFIAIGFLADAFFSVHLSIDVAWWIWGAIGLAIAVGLNHFGVRPAVRGVLLLAGISALPFIFLAISILVQGGADGLTLSVFDPGQTSWDSVFNGILFVVTLFIGFEIAASLGEETHNPRRSIPIAVLGTVAICAVFYLLVSYAATVGFGAANIGDWPANPSPIGALADQYVGSGLSAIIDLVVMLDALSVAIAFVVGASRIFFVFGRDRLLPPVLARTSKRDTPLGGNAVIVVAGIAALIAGGVTNYGAPLKIPDEVEAFAITATAGSFLIEAIYFILAIVAFRLVWQARAEGGLWWKFPVLVVAVATPVLAYKGALDPWPEYPGNRAPLLAAIGFAASALWWAYLRLRHPDRIRDAAHHATSHAGVPPMDEKLDYEPVEEDGVIHTGEPPDRRPPTGPGGVPAGV